MSLPDRAIVLSAGLGTRVRPLSFVRSKFAFPVAGVPLGRRIVGTLARQGVRRVVLNLHHRPETITWRIGDGQDLGVEIKYSWEPVVLGSAGGPRRALPLLESRRFYIVNGDTLADVHLAELAAVHGATGALVTMALVRNPSPHQYGGVLLKDGWVTGFSRPGSDLVSYHFVGVQIAEAAAFDDLPDDEPTDSVGWLYPSLIHRNSRAIRGYVCAARFLDVGTAADYHATSLVLSSDERRRQDAGDGCRVDPTAELVRTILWDDVTVGRACRLVDCVVADGVTVPDGTCLDNAAVIDAAAAPPDYDGRRIGDILVAPLRSA